MSLAQTQGSNVLYSSNQRSVHGPGKMSNTLNIHVKQKSEMPMGFDKFSKKDSFGNNIASHTAANSSLLPSNNNR
jgi:hypothetical protein